MKTLLRNNYKSWENIEKNIYILNVYTIKFSSHNIYFYIETLKKLLNLVNKKKLIKI